MVQIITAEHKLVDTLFEAYKTETNPQQKRGIANNIIKLLSIHGHHTQQPTHAHYHLSACGAASDSPAACRVCTCRVTGCAEEMSIYPYVAKNLPNGQQMASDALAEHLRMKEDLYQLDQSELDSPTFDASFQALVRDTQHHVKGEESHLLPELKKACTAAEMKDMADTFIRMKAVSPSRPHPQAPNTPPANIAVNTTAVPLDAAKDMAQSRFA